MRKVIIAYLGVKGVVLVTNNLFRFLLTVKAMDSKEQETMDALELCIHTIDEQLEMIGNCSKKYLLEIERDKIVATYKSLGGKKFE